MCELCVDIAQLNNIPYTLPRVVSLPPEIVLSARGFQRKLILVLTIKFLVSCQNQIGV